MKNLIKEIKKLNKKVGIKNTDAQLEALNIEQLNIVLSHRSTFYNYILNNRLNK
jgi:hypothetical protein